MIAHIWTEVDVNCERFFQRLFFVLLRSNGLWEVLHVDVCSVSRRLVIDGRRTQVRTDLIVFCF